MFDATLIIGAGELGREVRNYLSKQDNFGFLGYLDDSYSHDHLAASDVSIIGSISNLQELAQSIEISDVVVAINLISPEKLRELKLLTLKLSIRFWLISNLNSIITRNAEVEITQDLTIERLFGFRNSFGNLESTEGFFRDKTVLVTGAAGSIGSELCKQLSNISGVKLHMFDKDENRLLKLCMKLDLSEKLSHNRVFLGDIRDKHVVNHTVSMIKPDIIFHTAALKHLNILERFPAEAFKTNVLGTHNLLESANSSGASVFVNISTDKAANPSSVLGFTKLLSEELTSGFSNTDNRYISVRFGNVLGSNGSFLEIFRSQIESNKEVTVSHPAVSRYFMTISEAVHLILRSVIVGDSGCTMVLNMGTPVRIMEIAEFMIQLSQKNIPISITGLNRGEKLHESITSDFEKLYPTPDEEISKIHVENTQIDKATQRFESFLRFSHEDS